MNQSELLNLMDHFAQSGLHRMEYEAQGTRLVLEKNAPMGAGALAMPFAAQPVAVSAPVAASAQAQGAAGAAGNAVAQNAPETTQNAQEVKAPLVGVFYRAAAPGEAPFVKEGDSVKKGQVLCLIEAMKMMNELKSPVDGVVSRILSENEAVVSFGQVLFEVAPC